MKILWLAWKDKKHPGAGGAEVVLHELSGELLKAGHEVTILTARYPGSLAKEVLEGITIIRVGTNRYTHPLIALIYYLRHMRNRFDIVVETVNTAPYFAALFKNNGRKPFLFYHQLARKIWYHEAPFPVNHLGYYFIEPLSTLVLGKSGAPTLTISASTKKDLQRFGFKPQAITIISQVNHLTPLENIDNVAKYDSPTLLSFGAVRGMKQTIDQVKAFELAKVHIPHLQLKIAGDTSGPYGERLKQYIDTSPRKADISVLGRVSHAEKVALMQKSHLISVSSVKEGWGLIVTEAAGQGTPAVVYNTDGLRDSVRHLETGIVTAANPAALAKGIRQALNDQTLYKNIRHEGWKWSRHFTLERSYKDFTNALGLER